MDGLLGPAPPISHPNGEKLVLRLKWPFSHFKRSILLCILRNGTPRKGCPSLFSSFPILFAGSLQQSLAQRREGHLMMRCTHLLLVAQLTTVTVDAALSSGLSGVARRVVVDAPARRDHEDHRCSSRSYIRRRQRSWNHSVLGFGTTTSEQPTISTEARSERQPAKTATTGTVEADTLSSK